MRLSNPLIYQTQFIKCSLTCYHTVAKTPIFQAKYLETHDVVSLLAIPILFKQPVAGSDGIQVGVWGRHIRNNLCVRIQLSRLHNNANTEHNTHVSNYTKLYSFTNGKSRCNNNCANFYKHVVCGSNTLGITALAAIIMIVIVAVCIPIALRSKIHQRH